MNKPRPYARTGLNALKAKVKVRGLQAIDRRTLAAKGLLQWKADLTADLGGDDNLSAQQKAIIETVVRTRLFLDHVDSYLLALPSLVNHRKRCVLPIVRERIQLADALARYLGQLGLERKARDLTPTLEVIRQQFAKVSNGEGPADGR
jgi:hypothetical protein